MFTRHLKFNAFKTKILLFPIKPGLSTHHLPLLTKWQLHPSTCSSQKLHFTLNNYLRVSPTFLTCTTCCAVSCLVAQWCPTLWALHELWPARLLCPWGFSRKESWSGSPCPPPVDFPNPGLLHSRRILYHLSYQGSPRILEWVAYPFSRRTSQSRNHTGVSWISGSLLTSWATWEAQYALYLPLTK